MSLYILSKPMPLRSKRQILEKAESLLTFDEGFGSWRLSKTADIIYPTQKLYSYMDVNNHLIQVKPLVVNRLEVPDSNRNNFCKYTWFSSCCGGAHTENRRKDKTHKAR
jgi:hypothetical protein